MAWRIDEQLVRGEIDNRARGRVTGRLWFLGREKPVVLDLAGDAWRDIAGHLVRFTNPSPKRGAPGALEGFAPVQHGVVGDITASRKVKVPECSVAEMMRLAKAGKPFPWHWSNSLYLEWHGEQNGRVVIESAAYRIEIDPDASWRMGAAEERARREANERAARESLDRLVTEAANADADGPDFDDGSANPEPGPLTPEEEAERAEWIAQMNAAAEEALQKMKSEDEGDKGFTDGRWHPLVERCNALTHRLRAAIEARGWLGDDDTEGHPLRELVDGVSTAGGKLAGALGTMDDAEDWPPDPLLAGAALTRLKKARAHLRDALAGLDAADERDLAEAGWRREVREETADILAEVLRLISEVRAVLKISEEGGRDGK